MNTKIFGVTGRFSLFVLLLLGSFAARAATIDQAAFCVDGGSFHFDVQVTGGAANEELILRIAADSDPFVRPVERIALNFDATTGEFTRNPPLEPEVQTLDAAGEDPEFDRWVDGLIADYELVDLGDLSWRFEGSVPHGNDPFSSGDTIWGVALRSFTSPDDFLQDLPVTACESQDIAINVPFSRSEPTIDGVLALGEWRDAVHFDIDHGFMKFVHDNERLYVLIDVLDDNVDDSFLTGGGDQFWLLFDIDENGAITPGVDVRYRLQSGTGNLRYQTFCDDCLFGFNSLEPGTFSSRGEGFDCFFEDGSITILPGLSCNAHRVWEVALDLDELQMRTDQSTRFGYLVGSGSPLLSENFPADLNDMGSYGVLTLEELPRQLSSTGPGAMNPQFEVSQTIQVPDDPLDLAAGKPTAVRVWDSANDSAVKVFVYGQRGPVDLPGSPLLDVANLYSDSPSAPSNPRDTIVWNSFNRLPDTWASGGTVDYDVVIRGLDDSAVANLSAEIKFAPTDTPVFWTVPVRNEFDDGTTLVADGGQMTTSERLMRQMVPLRDVTLVRRPELEVSNITTSADLKTELKTYDQQTVLAWMFGLLFTGSSPFDLPDQITGFHDGGLTGGSGSTAGGSSDPVWSSGNGRITWVNDGNTSGYTHELNHNLDTDATGTWGRHSRGCGAVGTDGSWPYGNNSTIQEVGLRWAGMQFVSIPETKPDLMSYCRSGAPDRYFSPYRWEAWLDLFRTDVASKSRTRLRALTKNGGPVDSFYVQGRVFPQGGGQLGQILNAPGLASIGADGGEYVLEVLACDDSVLAGLSFNVSFVDPEGEPEPYVGFNFTLPAPAESCAIELSRGGVVLDSRVISEHAPVVTLTSPNGGEVWAGIETATWEASDADGDGLSFTLLYSQDGGMTWLPVATNIAGNSFDVDAAGLPGSTDARLRVLASDGANTAQDDSDAAFTVAMKPPAVEILAPRDNGVFGVDEALVLEGNGRDTFGNALPGESLMWDVDGTPVGIGEIVEVHLDEGDHVIVLAAMGPNGLVGTDSVAVTVSDLDGTGDPADVGLASVDVSEAQAFVADDRLVCETSVRSGEHGLESGSRFACHVDFDDLELEAESGCDADGDGFLDDTYRLGSNGMCSTSDMALTYRHERGGRGAGKAGGSCTGGPSVICETREFDGNGLGDDECDGDVGGEPAVSCLVRVSGLLSTVAGERDAQCADPEDGCLGGVDPVTGSYRAYNHFEAHFREFKDWVPDTDDGGTPNSTDEVVLIPLVR